MSDLRSQLSAAFGTPVPAAEPATEAPALGILDPDAHLDSDWLACLRRVSAKVPGAPALGDRPKLAQVEQIGHTVIKALKKAGRKREAQELRELQRTFLARREKAAWAALKLRFSELGLSDKTYRALKQGETDPLKALVKLEKADPAELAGMGHARLRELLA